MLLRLLSFLATSFVAVTLGLIFTTLPVPQSDPANAYFQERTIYNSGLRGTKTLALTFDDGPSAYTHNILDTLAKYNIKATFFVLGSRAAQHEDILRRMSDEGHVIANHSLSHPKLGRKYADNPELLIAQIGGTQERIAPFLRQGQGLYFRAPYGIWRKVHAAVLNEDPVLRNYVGPIYWEIGGSIEYDGDGNVRSAADWDCWARDWSTEDCKQGYLREIRSKEGGIMLMHDIRERSVWLVDQIVPELVAEGYRFVTLDQVPGLDPYRTPGMVEVPIASLRGSITERAAPYR